MRLLSIDTSTRGCSVAIHDRGELLAAYELFSDKSSSSMLTTLIQNVVKDSGYDLTDMDSVVVAKGPGSYTGLRVGVSTAKGICYAIEKPLIAINTLEGMFMQVRGFFQKNTLFCPMIDARRMEVYSAVFDFDGQIITPTRAVILQEDSFAEVLETNQVVFFGDGAAKSQVLFSKHPHALFIQEEIKPSAKTIGMMAVKSFEAGQFENLASFEPYYLKDFMTPPSRKADIPA
ncbi:tRNA (adenosine(37)-N6)-threonylcarbamoyltransferase complex dimerization subunit type 1 TsaB [Dyadobacter sp. 32]|uniref:tRNA (adenosine(37)-N6)-threonylcarbamoyltransferase complex dimerization subunit type 1 TsaB n=1 Tax=Dyadobacter sp. 32 TaxID=538966 RepID=UPI0011EEDC06